MSLKHYKVLFENTVTVSAVNQAIKSLGYKMYAGNGYYYFQPINYKNPKTPMLSNESIYVHRISEFKNINDIINILNEKIKETLRYR